MVGYGDGRHAVLYGCLRQRVMVNRPVEQAVSGVEVEMYKL
jgi:hypothetical protein